MTETNDPKPTTFVEDGDVDLTYQQRYERLTAILHGVEIHPEYEYSFTKSTITHYVENSNAICDYSSMYTPTNGWVINHHVGENGYVIIGDACLQTTHKETIVQCHFMKKRDEGL